MSLLVMAKIQVPIIVVAGALLATLCAVLVGVVFLIAGRVLTGRNHTFLLTFGVPGAWIGAILSVIYQVPRLGVSLFGANAEVIDFCVAAMVSAILWNFIFLGLGWVGRRVPIR